MRAGRPELLEGRAQPTHLAFREADELPGGRLGRDAPRELDDAATTPIVVQPDISDGLEVKVLHQNLGERLRHQ